MSLDKIATKPSLLEMGMPCASLSAECQRDNNARQHPPQNRLHVWWARRPPTVCRAAILAALLPFDFTIAEQFLPSLYPEPSEKDLEGLPQKYKKHQLFFKMLITDIETSKLTNSYSNFLRILGILGDSNAAFKRLLFRERYLIDGSPIIIPQNWTYRYPPAIYHNPTLSMMVTIHNIIRNYLGLEQSEQIIVCDPMAGGGTIPFEALRYGFKTFANELNPVAAVILKATLQYPACFGLKLTPILKRYAMQIIENTKTRLITLFPIESKNEWWKDEYSRINSTFNSPNIILREPSDVESIKNCYFWCHTLPCPKCGLKIPLITNFYIIKKKGSPEKHLVAFPEVPEERSDCTFRFVRRAQLSECHWPALHPGECFHPTDTPTFKDGKAVCPRCGMVMEGEQVRSLAKARQMGNQLYGITSKVPVRLTYRNGDVKVRYLWRFRPPTAADLEAVAAAGTELERLLPGWEAVGLVPDELIPEGEKTREPLNVGFSRWRDFFLPRQLLTNMVILEEIKQAQRNACEELPPDQAEAISLYLSFMLSKIVNYNSVSTSWDDTRLKIRSSIMGHDFRFHGAFCEFEGARELVKWAASQVIDAYTDLARLAHGGIVDTPGTEDDNDGCRDDEEDINDNPIDAVVEENGDMDKNGFLEATAPDDLPLRQEIILPTITCADAAALEVPSPGSVHLICVDPPYYNNVQYAELSNFFYVWLKRALMGVPGFELFVRDYLTEREREAVACPARFRRQAEEALQSWKLRHEELRARYMVASGPKPAIGVLAWRREVKAAEQRALDDAGSKPPNAAELAGADYEQKMRQIFVRSRRLLHPQGRMVVMFNHKQTWAWRSLGMALIQAGFEILSSVPIRTEAESSLNIRGLDAARSTILLLCLPRQSREQPPGNWAAVQRQVVQSTVLLAEHFQEQGLDGTDLYLSVLGPALRVVSRQWPVTTYSGDPVDLEEVLNAAYAAVAKWRLTKILNDVKERVDNALADTLDSESIDQETQALWIWLDTFQGERAGSDDVRKLSKSLGVDPEQLKRMRLIRTEKEMFVLLSPLETDMQRISRMLTGASDRGRLADAWEWREFPNFLGAAVWNAIALMAGVEPEHQGEQALRRWLYVSGTGCNRYFVAAYAVTLMLLEKYFLEDRDEGAWQRTAKDARRAWDLVLRNWRG